MKIKLNAEEKKALLAYMEASEDCEKIMEHEWVMDIYDIDTPISVDFVFKKDSLFADGAEYLSYDEEMDGYYMSGAVESADRLIEILRGAGALGE